MGEFVRVERDGAIATIRLDRPPMNALSIQVQDEIAAAAGEAGADPAIRAVVVYGGGKVFAAKNIIYTGRFVPAAEARKIGLVDKVVPDGEVYQAARDMTARYTAGPALALQAAKQAIDDGPDADLAAGLEIERLHLSGLFATEDRRAGMRSFIEHGPGKATFTGR